MMKFYKKINGWVIKEKKIDEVPSTIEDNRRYGVFTPEDRFMEDNLTLDEAIEFCNNNDDFAKK